MPNQKQSPKELKVTDKRIFTPEGEIRDEFKTEIHPAEPQVAATPAEKTEPQQPAKEQERKAEQRPQEERRRTMADRAKNPGTPFTIFLESLILQAYMSLGMLRNPYEPQPKIDTAAARQLIDILTMLGEKTAGNLTLDEHDYLDAHLGELKLAFVQRTKSI